MNADALEVAWTLVSLAGLLLALGEHSYALDDRRLVSGEAPVPGGGRRSVRRERQLELALVDGDVATARWILAIEAANLLVGLGAMASEPTPGGRSPLGWVLVALLVAGAAAMPLWLLGKRRRRARLLGGRVRPPA